MGLGGGLVSHLACQDFNMTEDMLPRDSTNTHTSANSKDTRTRGPSNHFTSTSPHTTTEDGEKDYSDYDFDYDETLLQLGNII